MNHIMPNEETELYKSHAEPTFTRQRGTRLLRITSPTLGRGDCPLTTLGDLFRNLRPGHTLTSDSIGPCVSRFREGRRSV